MSMDDARSRFPECPSCGNGVDGNAPEEPSVLIRQELWHSKCAKEAGEGEEDHFDLMMYRLRKSAVTTNPRVA